MNDDLSKPNVDLVIEKLKDRTCDEHQNGVQFLVEGGQVSIVAPCCDKFRDEIETEFINELKADLAKRTIEHSQNMLNDAISQLGK